MSEREMRITLTAWRQAGPDAPGAFETYDVPGVSPDMSFLEMLDLVNERLIVRRQGTDRVRPRLPRGHLRLVRDDDQRSGARSRAQHRDVPAAHAQVPRRRPHHDRAVARRGVPDDQGPHRRPQPVRRASSSRAATSASTRAARSTGTRSRSRSRSPTRRWTPPRASAAARAWPRVPTAPPSSSPSAKLQHLNLLPQGQAERWDRTVNMVETMESYFGSCTNHRECEAACPKSISIDFIALMNRDYVKAQFKQRRLVGQSFP